MAVRQATQTFIESLPQNERELATAIFDRVPPAHHAALRDVITRLNSGGHLRDGLIHLDSITSSERFSPAYLGTVSLIIQKSGENHINALSEYSRIINTDRFNRHVDETVRLTVVRTGEHSSESLRALYFLFSNPNFQQQDLTITFPGRFLAFIDAAKRNSPDFEHMAYRALASMFVNEQFTPSMLTPQFATRFGQMVRAISERAGASRLAAMEAFACALGNRSVRPDEMTVAHAERIAQLCLSVIEHRPSGRMDERVPPEVSLRRLNLILGHRRFRLDLISESGLLSTYLNSSGNVPQGIERFQEFLRNARHSEHAVGAVELMVRGGMRPQEALMLVNAVLRNPSLSPRLGDERFVRSLIETRDLLFRGSHLNYMVLMTTQIDLFSTLLAHPQMTAETYDAVSRMLNSLGANSDVAVLYLSRYLTGSSFRGIDERFLSDLTRIVNECVSRNIDHQDMARIFMIDFHPRMIREDGILSIVFSRSTPENVSGLLSNISLVQQKGALARAEPLIREILRIGGVGTPDSIYALANISIGGLSQAQADALLGLITASGARHHLALRIYHQMKGNPSLAGVMLSETYLARIAALIRRIPSGRASETATLLSQIMNNRSFRAPSLAILERISEQAGPNAHFVFEFLFTIQNARKADLSRAMTPEFIRFLSRAASVIHRYGGAVESKVQAAFSSLLVEMHEGRRVGSAFDILARSEELLEFIDRVGRSAGPMAPYALMSVLPAIRRINFNNYDAERVGRWLGGYFSRLAADQRESAVDGVSHTFAAMAQRPRLRELLLEEPELYRRGRALAESLITDRPISPEVILNFAYAIDEIGEERVRAIHQRFGIRYFARYSNDVLERLYENRQRPADRSKPSAFVVFPYSDWNGAFYSSGARFDALLDSHNVMIFECGTEDGFYSAAEQFRSRYGRTDTVVIGGHGSPEAITLGNVIPGQTLETVQLDLTDGDEILRLRNILGSRPHVILVSCSTGKNEQAIGGVMSGQLGAVLYAPRIPSNIRQFVVDDQGRVAVIYDDEAKGAIFFQGQDVEEDRPRRRPRQAGI